jgi:hypothetical protein
VRFINDSKHVQLELSAEEHHRIDPNDPLFDILDELEEKPLPDKPRTNAAMEDDLIEEWSGSTSDVKFPGSSDREE